MNYPEYVKVGDKLYKINTDFRVAIECDRIAKDETINDYERALAILYTLYGDEGLNDTENYEVLLEKAKKYLSCGEEINGNEESDMDYIEDYSYIKTSFRSDYGIRLDEEDIHWWEFNDLMNGLSNSETGNCCILNRIRNLRNYDLKEVKDAKERDKIRKAQERVALKKNKRKATDDQVKSAMELYKRLNL